MVICNVYASSVRSSVDNNAGLSDLFVQGFDGALPLPFPVLIATTSRDTGGVVDVTGVGSMGR